MSRANLAVAAALVLSGCAAPAMLYPANDLARPGGVLKATLIVSGTGSGPVTVTMPDGELLTGRYNVNLGGSVGFGSLYTSVYGPRGVSTGSGFSSMSMFDVGSPAAADLAGPKGTTMHCEVFNNNYTGHGNGACETSTGARYRIQY